MGMLAGTALLAAAVVAVLWFVVLQRIKRYSWAGYTVLGIVALACFVTGTVHLAYVGVEVLLLGGAIVHMTSIKKGTSRD